MVKQVNEWVDVKMYRQVDGWVVEGGWGMDGWMNMNRQEMNTQGCRQKMR